jgi:RNA polymerase sigma factor (sigma-70 family)
MQPDERLQSDLPTDTGVAQLTRRLAAGDEAAFREFHARYFDQLYAFLLVVARGQEHEAQEALQETLLRVARHARIFDDPDVFWCWLKAVARNTARDGGRKRTRYLTLLRDFALGLNVAAPVPATVEDGRLGALLDEALTGLDEADRRLVAAKYLEGSTIRELAALAGQTEKAVESRLLRLRRDLRAGVLKKLSSP